MTTADTTALAPVREARRSHPAPPAARPRRGASRRESRIGWAFALPFTALFALSMIAPIIASLWNSLFRRQLSMGGLGGTETVFSGLANYVDVLTSDQFWGGIVNVLEYGAIKIPLVQGLALVLALLLDSLAARGVRFFRLTAFLPYAIPGVVAALVWGYLYSPTLSPFADLLQSVGLPADLFLEGGLLNLSMANMTAWTFIGYNMIIFMATLKSIPAELYDAARIDGASEWQIVLRIKLPMLKSAALMTVLMSIVGTIQWFNEPTVLRTMTPAIDTAYTPMMMAYSQAFDQNDMGGAAATSVIMAIIAGLLAGVYALVQTRIGRAR
ncbi:sugar ABC transporter permease [Microbacterium sp.]|uniref:carbohydrate ABC transporter permease n=1 Tax=Microbacterium sp. TaxID=51671 RepID=UPI0028AF0C92|nr:sugar ABC transporter permease [Microbacterium sp.]